MVLVLHLTGDIADLTGDIADLTGDIADLTADIADLTGKSHIWPGTSSISICMSVNAVAAHVHCNASQQPMTLVS